MFKLVESWNVGPYTFRRHNYNGRDVFSFEPGKSTGEYYETLESAMTAAVGGPQITAETRRYAEHARAARDAFHAFHEFDDNDVSEERVEAEQAATAAAAALVEQVLYEIDNPS